MDSLVPSKLLARFSLICVCLGLITVASAAASHMMDWHVVGKGNGGGCMASPCVVSSSGDVKGPHLDDGKYSFQITAGPLFPNPSGGNCATANGSGMLSGAAEGDGDDASPPSGISFKTIGVMCEEDVPGSALHYNGTYRITSGTGSFTGAAGSGNFAATVGTDGTAFVSFTGMLDF